MGSSTARLKCAPAGRCPQRSQGREVDAKHVCGARDLRKTSAPPYRRVRNIDLKTVEGFGEEWATFDQLSMDEAEWRRHFDGYFSIFPFRELPKEAVGFDLGCGSGRWAAGVAPRVGLLHCIDPSEKALAVAKSRLAAYQNVAFHCADVDSIPLPTEARISGTPSAYFITSPTLFRRCGTVSLN